MSVTVKFRNLTWNPDLQEQIMERIEDSLDKFGRHRFRSTAKLDVDGHTGRVFLHVHSDGADFSMEEFHEEPGKAVAHLLERLESAMRRRCDKRKINKKSPHKPMKVAERIINRRGLKRSRTSRYAIISEFDKFEEEYSNDVFYGNLAS